MTGADVNVGPCKLRQEQKMLNRLVESILDPHSPLLDN